MVSGYSTSTSIPQVDGLLTGPSRFGASQAKHGLSHVMRLKTNFGLRKPFSHLGISILREKNRARACEERRLVIFLQVTKILRDQEEEGCLVLNTQKIKGMETKP